MLPISRPRRSSRRVISNWGMKQLDTPAGCLASKSKSCSVVLSRIMPIRQEAINQLHNDKSQMEKDDLDSPCPVFMGH
jgi:hypothetical protein